MTPGEAVGSVGVGTLLIAFLLNISGRVAPDSRIHLALNCFGAALACVASMLIRFVPFVLLEGFWSVVAVATLVRLQRKTTRLRGR
jgi:hypothetical protein